MGFSLTGTHVVYFIASVIIASAVSGVLIAVTTDINTGVIKTGERIQNKLDYDFKIINDPDNIPLNGSNYQFYLKNIGGKEIATTTTEFHLFIDGELISSTKYNFADSSIKVGEATIISVENTEISEGYHKLRVVGPQAIEDEFVFSI